jgi:hypothetical protein
MIDTELWTSRECAEYRRCSLRTLDRERERGDGCPYIRIGARIYYRPSDVEGFIAAHVCGGKRASAAVVTEPPLSSSVTPERRRGRSRKSPTTAGAHAP